MPIFTPTFRYVDKTANYTAIPYDIVLCDVETTGSFTVTLPSSPFTGAEIMVVLDTKSTAGRYVDINPNGNTIGGDSSTIRVIIKGNSLLLKYDGSSNWVVMEWFTNDHILSSVSITSSSGLAAFADEWSMYPTLKLSLSNYRPVNAGDYLAIQTSANYGSTYDTTATHYTYDGTYGGRAVAATAFGATIASGILILGSWGATSFAYGGADVTIQNHANAVDYTQWISSIGTTPTGGAPFSSLTQGYHAASSVDNGFKLFASTGNIAELEATLRGFR